jgi:ATPase subunit of ABC transporter with duplicated ATPase domains
MLHLKITNLYFKYNRTSQYLFENIHLTFEPTWSCIVGANGMGKSTLLKLISKKLLTEQGEIKGNELVHYCAQSTENIPPHFETFMHTYNKTTFRLKEQLGIHDDWLYRWDTLSHGERKRVQIAIALFINPDVLLLDEPTNHLDNTTKSIIFNALKSFTKIGLLVSHDRQLLDELCSHTFLIKDDEILSFKTNHSNAMHEYQKQQQHLYQTQLTQKKEFKKIKHSVQIQKQKVVKSQARLSKSTLDKRDSDLKNKINLAKLTGKDKKRWKSPQNTAVKKKATLIKSH